MLRPGPLTLRPSCKGACTCLIRILLMKMTKSLPIALMLGWAMGAQAGDYTHLTFQKTDSTTLALDVTSLTMTFSGSQLLATNTQGSYSLTLADLAQMFFSNGPATGVAAVDADAASAPVTVYTLTGATLGTYDRLSAFTRQAPKGVYIVKSNGRTFKTTVR
jgi:hypothetical protein